MELLISIWDRKFLEVLFVGTLKAPKLHSTKGVNKKFYTQGKLFFKIVYYKMHKHFFSKNNNN